MMCTRGGITSRGKVLEREKARGCDKNTSASILLGATWSASAVVAGGVEVGSVASYRVCSDARSRGGAGVWVWCASLSHHNFVPVAKPAGEAIWALISPAAASAVPLLKR